MHGSPGYTLSQPTDFVPSLGEKGHFSSPTQSGGGESFEHNDGKDSEEEDNDDSEYMAIFTLLSSIKGRSL